MIEAEHNIHIRVVMPRSATFLLFIGFLLILVSRTASTIKRNGFILLTSLALPAARAVAGARVGLA